ncbi:hypothetical protein HK405_015753, partial [Cladochytrium tenue]
KLSWTKAFPVDAVSGSAPAVYFRPAAGAEPASLVAIGHVPAGTGDADEDAGYFVAEIDASSGETLHRRVLASIPEVIEAAADGEAPHAVLSSTSGKAATRFHATSLGGPRAGPAVVVGQPPRFSTEQAGGAWVALFDVADAPAAAEKAASPDEKALAKVPEKALEEAPKSTAETEVDSVGDSGSSKETAPEDSAGADAGGGLDGSASEEKADAGGLVDVDGYLERPAAAEDGWMDAAPADDDTGYGAAVGDDAAADSGGKVAGDGLEGLYGDEIEAFPAPGDDLAIDEFDAPTSSLGFYIQLGLVVAVICGVVLVLRPDGRQVVTEYSGLPGPGGSPTGGSNGGGAPVSNLMRGLGDMLTMFGGHGAGGAGVGGTAYRSMGGASSSSSGEWGGGSDSSRVFDADDEEEEMIGMERVGGGGGPRRPGSAGAVSSSSSPPPSPPGGRRGMVLGHGRSTGGGSGGGGGNSTTALLGRTAAAAVAPASSGVGRRAAAVPSPSSGSASAAAVASADGWDDWDDDFAEEGGGGGKRAGAGASTNADDDGTKDEAPAAAVPVAASGVTTGAAASANKPAAADGWDWD